MRRKSSLLAIRGTCEGELHVTARNDLGGDLDAALGPAPDTVTKGSAAVDAGFLQGLQPPLLVILDRPPTSFTTRK